MGLERLRRRRRCRQIRAAPAGSGGMAAGGGEGDGGGGDDGVGDGELRLLLGAVGGGMEVAAAAGGRIGTPRRSGPWWIRPHMGGSGAELHVLAGGGGVGGGGVPAVARGARAALVRRRRGHGGCVGGSWRSCVAWRFAIAVVASAV